MEPIKGVDGFMPDTSFVRDLTVKNRNYTLPDENSVPAFSGIPFALFILSTAFLLLNNTPSVKRKYKNVHIYIYIYI